jgi:hypothetical protein
MCQVQGTKLVVIPQLMAVHCAHMHGADQTPLNRTFVRLAVARRLDVQIPPCARHPMPLAQGYEPTRKKLMLHRDAVQCNHSHSCTPSTSCHVHPLYTTTDHRLHLKKSLSSKRTCATLLCEFVGLAAETNKQTNKKHAEAVSCSTG